MAVGDNIFCIIFKSWYPSSKICTMSLKYIGWMWWHVEAETGESQVWSQPELRQPLQNDVLLEGRAKMGRNAP